MGGGPSEIHNIILEGPLALLRAPPTHPLPFVPRRGLSPPPANPP